jgi:hypothetical protein
MHAYVVTCNSTKKLSVVLLPLEYKSSQKFLITFLKLEWNKFISEVDIFNPILYAIKVMKNTQY